MPTSCTSLCPQRSLIGLQPQRHARINLSSRCRFDAVLEHAVVIFPVREVGDAAEQADVARQLPVAAEVEYGIGGDLGGYEIGAVPRADGQVGILEVLAADRGAREADVELPVAAEGHSIFRRYGR